MRDRIAAIRYKHSPTRDPEFKRFLNERTNRQPLKHLGSGAVLDLQAEFDSQRDTQLLREIAKAAVQRKTRKPSSKTDLDKADKGKGKEPAKG